MDLIVLLGIALGLAMDAFAVSIAVSVAIASISKRQVFRLAWHFGLFQALMPIVGWLAGSTVRPLIESWDHWLAFVLLAAVGGRMIIEARRVDDHESQARDPTRGWSLIILSIATSIDALAVGLSFAALGIEVWIPAVIIGITACAATVIGTIGGKALGLRFGSRMALIGGIVLIVIGCWIVFKHVAGA